MIRSKVASIGVLATLAGIGLGGAADADILLPGTVWCHPSINASGSVETVCENDTQGDGGGPAGDDSVDPDPRPTMGNHLIRRDTKSPPAIYRLVNFSNGDHLLTSSYDEANGAKWTYGYEFEQYAARFAPDGAAGATPLYRGMAGVDHFYTTSWPEMSGAINVYGYSYEGVAGWVYAANWAGTCALYRTQIGPHHFYTASWTEAAQVLSHGGNYEGITGYVLPYSGSSCPQ